MRPGCASLLLNGMNAAVLNIMSEISTNGASRRRSRISILGLGDESDWAKGSESFATVNRVAGHARNSASI